MRNIGLLLTKNEASIIADTLQQNIRFVKEIYVLDGGDDDTKSVVNKFPEVTAYYHEKDLLPSNFKAVDSIRQAVLKIIVAHSKPGDWITLMHGDEMFFHNPQTSIDAAEKLDCNLVQWYAAHFFPHRRDLKIWDELKNLPVYKRFTYYAHYKNSCWIEDRQFKITEGMYYSEAEGSGVLPITPVSYKALPAYPIYHHYKVWDLDLNNYTIEHSSKYNKKVARPAGKWGVIHYSPRKFEQFFINKYPKYPCTSKFEGSFGTLSQGYDSLLSKLSIAK